MVSILGQFSGLDKAKVKDEWKEEEEYLSQLHDVLTTRSGASITNLGPTQLTDFLYLGSAQDASSRQLLKRLGITHIINCATKVPQDVIERVENGSTGQNSQTHISKAAAVASGVEGYTLLGADDSPGYEILTRHYDDVRRSIESARRAGGKVLVHCELGINRSTTLCVAYLIDTLNLSLMKAVKKVKFDRPNILCNEGFRRQLFHFARERDLLHTL